MTFLHIAVRPTLLKHTLVPYILLNLYENTSKSVHKKGFGTMTEFFPRIATVTLTLDLKFRTANLFKIMLY